VHAVPFEVVTSRPADGIRVVAVQGELDLNTAPKLEEMLNRAVDGGGSLVVDLSGCDFIDSTGVALLIRTWQSLGDGASPRRFVLSCPNRQVRRLFEITGLDDQIQIVDDAQDAVMAAGRSTSPEAS
jgi:anti-sigma B factor antagonist